MPFSLKSRNAIRDRSREEHEGVLSDEMTGLPAPIGNAAHIDHSKQNGEYDDPDNGLWVSLKTHEWMHKVDEDNGLTPEANAYIARSIHQRISKEKR